MKTFDAPELEGIVRAINASMVDTCTVDAYTELAGELNEPEVTYVPGPVTRCRYRAGAGFYRPGGNYDVAGIDGILHLPLETAVTSRDRVTILSRFGKRLTAVHSYAVVGEPSPGIGSLELKLQEAHL